MTEITDDDHENVTHILMHDICSYCYLCTKVAEDVITRQGYRMDRKVQADRTLIKSAERTSRDRHTFQQVGEHWERGAGGETS